MTSSRSRPRFDPLINYYQVLDVPYSATREQITRAYRDLMRVTHPDNFQDPDQRAKAEERSKLVNAAYAVLSRPDVRREYDAQMRGSALADSLMQRYTGNAPGRPSPYRTPPRPPSPRVVRAQRQAYNAAVRQLMLSTAAFVIGLLVVILIIVLADQGLHAIVG